MAVLINGNGNRAIYAAQDADLIASLAGNVTCIANVGNKYAATIEDANTIGLADGVIITKEGRRIQLDAGNVDLFAIPTGSSGVTNYYIIGYKLVQQADSSQVAETFVQKMNSSSATIAEGTLRGGDNEVYVSLYRVTQVGFNIDSVSRLLPELTNISELNSELDKYYEQRIYIFGDDTIRTKTFVLPDSQHDIVAQLQYSVNIIVSMTIPTMLTIDPADYILMSGSTECAKITYNATNRTITLEALTPLDSHNWLIKILTR